MSGFAPTSIRLISLLGFLCLLFLLFFLIWISSRAGYAALLTANAASNNDLAAASEAVRLSPKNPDAHFLLGGLLEANGDGAAAMSHYQTAVTLRGEDYVLWIQLARARELGGDLPGAISAAKNAVAFAPFYAQPRWQLGNILVRAGQKEDGFAELRLAGAADPTLLPGIIDLAWQITGGDVQFVKQAIQPRTSESYLALGDYLKKRGQVFEAIAMFSAAGNHAGASQARGQYIAELISARKFKEAHALWTSGDAENASPPGRLTDPGFELETNLEKPGFGWQKGPGFQGVQVSLDRVGPRAGAQSILLLFDGQANPGAPVLTQLVLVEPNTRYRLRFSTRTRELVTGGLPIVALTDAGSGGLLGQSKPFPQAAAQWQDEAVEFLTAETTEAMLISFQRQSCSSAPCLIFGRVWLDEFSLEKLPSARR